METSSLLRPLPLLIPKRPRNPPNLYFFPPLNPNNPLLLRPKSRTTTLSRSLCRSGSSSSITQITNNAPEPQPQPDADGPKPLLSNWTPPRPLWRALSVLFLAGQVIHRASISRRVHWVNTLQQLERVGPRSLGVCLLTSAFVGMAFTIQFVREFTRLGLHRSVGGVLALAFARELSPVVTSVVVAGRVGSAFAAELGTMQVGLIDCFCFRFADDVA